MKQVASDDEDDIKQARDSMLTMIFLAGADKNRYEKLLNQMNNTYLAKKDEYPTSIDSVLSLLWHYRDHQSGRQKGSSSEALMERSFAQFQKRMAKVHCYECSEQGHYKRDCPRLRQSHLQQQDMGSLGNGSIRSAIMRNTSQPGTCTRGILNNSMTGTYVRIH